MLPKLWYVNAESAPSCVGKLPLSLAPARLRFFNAVSAPSCVGKLPLSWQSSSLQKTLAKPSTFLPERLEEGWRIQ